MIKNLYEKIDNTIMKGVNKAVQAWNWTTGGTKADLANAVLVGGLAAGTSMHPLSLFYGIPALVLGYRNMDIEKKEVEALEQNMLNYQAEEAKLENRTIGLIAAGNSALWAGISLLSSNDEIETKRCLLGFGITTATLAASAYISRADYFPPQKDCVRRGLEKLSELVDSYKIKPELIPVNALGD